MDKDTKNTLVVAFTVGIVCTIVGLILVIPFRIIFRSKSNLNIMNCFWVGLAALWPFLLVFAFTPDIKTKYDYEVQGGAVVFVQPPVEPVKISWSICAVGKVSSPLALDGMVDGKNKVFTVVDPLKSDLGENGSLLCLERGVPTERLVLRPYMSEYAKKFWMWSTVIVLVIGLAAFFGSLS